MEAKKSIIRQLEISQEFEKKSECDCIKQPSNLNLFELSP